MWRKNVAQMLILTLASALLTSNCASIIRHRTQGIPVTSSPAGAAVIVNGVEQGVTPLMIRLVRKQKGQVIRIESPGYNPVEIRPKRTVSGLILLDLPLGAALAFPIWYVYAIGHDVEDPGMRAGSVMLLSTAAFAGLFTAMDLGSKTKGYDFEPYELNLTLTKADGTPRVDTMVIDADDLQNVKWIRVHRD